MKIDKSQSIIGDGNQQAQGDIYNTTAPVNPFAKLLDELKTEAENDTNFQEMLEGLAEWLNDRDVIGLENKLITSGRSDSIRDAIYLKERFTKKLVRSQLSRATQRIYTHILAKIGATFRNVIKPKIAEGASKSEIDMLIQKFIIDDIYKDVSDPKLDIDQEHISGMLYFLTGKCHVNWQ